ncbi:MAG: S-layer homology domain-containing protein, partial [Clostridiales bacterium]|nr:S-layer homology domain-containing protein [Clostridiales bacterium]
MKKTLIIGGALALLLSLNAFASGFEKTLYYAEGQFSDVNENAWYAETVKNTFELGLMNGTGNGLFEPEGNVTVAEAITMASRACAINAGEDISEKDGEWYEKYVFYAKNKGFVKEGQFDNYDRAAKRHEVAELFEKAMPSGFYTPVNDVVKIPDVSSAKSYYGSVLALYKAGVAMGSDSFGNFLPENDITRAEAATIITRAALPEMRLRKTLDKISEDDAYALVLCSGLSGSHEGIASGWLLDNRGGIPRTSLSEPFGALFDIDENAGCAYIREMNKVTTGVVTMKTKILADTDMEGIYLEYRNEKDESVYRIEIIQNAWQIKKKDGSFEKIYEISENENEFEFIIISDLDNNRAQTYINRRGCGEYPLLTEGEDTNFINFRYATTDKSTAGFSIGSVLSYVNYAAYEDFATAKEASKPFGWTFGGKIGYGMYLTVPEDGYAATSFSPVSGNVVSEFQFVLPQGESISFSLKSGNKDVAVFTSDNDNFYVNGKCVYENYYENMWYRIRLELNTDTEIITVKLNGRVIDSVPFLRSATSVDNLIFKNEDDSDVWLDDVYVFRTVEHDDYVPRPKEPLGDEDYIIGMTVCSLWRDSIKSFYEWSKITPYKDHDLVMGFYDEGNPETADWEIKYMVEHGIDFQEFCIYFNYGYPLRSDAHHLYGGYMNAKYSDMLSFGAIYEADSSSNPGSLEEWKAYYVPYFIENFFKDPRYNVIDNKPVLTIYGIGSFVRGFGSIENAKAGMEYMNEEVKKLGFDGVMFLSNGWQGADVKELGFEGSHFYSGGRDIYTYERNVDRMKSDEVYNIPVVTVGFNSLAVGDDRTPVITVEDYKKAYKYARDEYLPKNAKEDWQKKLLYTATWNEYGEGHFIAPTKDEKGFGYIDAIRELFTKADMSDLSEIDVAPTESQQLRISHLYPQYRRLLRKEGYVKEKRPEGDFTLVGEIDMTKVDSIQEWSGKYSFTRDKNGISVTVEGSMQPMAVLHFAGTEFNLDEIDLVKIYGVIPYDTPVGIYYTTTMDSTMDERKHVYTSRSGEKAKKETVVEVDVSEEKNWNSFLSILRLDFGKDGIYSSIRKVEFYKNNAPELVKNIIINNNVTEMNFSVQKEQNGEPVIAFDPKKALDYQLNAFYTWERDKGELTLNFTDHVIVYTVGKDTYMLDGSEKPLGFTMREIDALPLIPIRMLCEDVGYECGLNENNEVVIKTKQYELYTELLKRKEEQSIEDYTWEFNGRNDTEGWTSTFMNLSTLGGFMSCQAVSTSNDPVIYYKNPTEINASDFTKFEIRVRYKYSASGPIHMQMYFSTADHGGMSERNSFRANYKRTDSEGEWETYVIDLTAFESWNGKITALRFDP